LALDTAEAQTDRLVLMMATRELIGPQMVVTQCDEDGSRVKVAFRVPGSRFGPVVVKLTPLEAERLARKLITAAAP
jgi:hypothetical protein